MKTLIRQKCFETNSSSCHSISIEASTSNTLLESITPNDEGVIEVDALDFGWDEEEFTDASTKLSYLLVYIRDWVEEDLKKEEFTNVLRQVVFAHTQAEDVKLREKQKVREYDMDGYIDHQSVEGEALNYLFETPELIRDFIFNPASVLKTDNDNH